MALFMDDLDDMEDAIKEEARRDRRAAPSAASPFGEPEFVLWDEENGWEEE